MNISQSSRAAELLQAQQKADELFKAVETQGLIRANMLESQLNQEIYDLAKQMFGISTYWHKHIVRAGRNTLAPYDENPPDLTVGADDILFLDFGAGFRRVGSRFRKDLRVGFRLGQAEATR